MPRAYGSQWGEPRPVRAGTKYTPSFESSEPAKASVSAASEITPRNGMSYGTFMHGLKLAGIEVDRKVLADIAVRDPETFRRFAESAREALPA